jgi:hypothetical protein
MERTEAQKVNDQLILAEGFAERAQVSVKREKIESRNLAQKLAERAQVSVKEAADREKNECRRLAQRAQVSVKEAADREKNESLAAADREKIETLAAEDGKRAEKIDSKRAEKEAKIDSKRAEKKAKIDSKRADKEAARVKINDEEAQLKRMRVDPECAMLCGAEGCGKGNQGQFESFIHASMRQHCCTQKHKVFNSAKCHFFDVYSSLMFTLLLQTEQRWDLDGWSNRWAT